jgi:hypothetical protein
MFGTRESTVKRLNNYRTSCIALTCVILSIILLLWQWYTAQPRVAISTHNKPVPQHQSSPVAPLNAIQQENQLPGTTDWQLTNHATYDIQSLRFPAIEGYAWSTSAAAGDILSFSVSTNAPFFSADIYRLGWYQGKGGRFIQSLPYMPGNFESMPSMDSRSGLMQADWPIAFTLKIEANWTSGLYIVKLKAATGEQGYIPFVVRSNGASDFAFIHAASTDEAYNNWGGKSLYNFNSSGGHRANKVSFDRPFGISNGAGYLLTWEYPMLRWLEENGFDVSYLSTSDVQDYPSLLRHHNGILIVGHNEYWSRTMRDNLEAVVNNGVNLANFAADSMCWQIRYESSTKNGIPGRIIVGYKDKALDLFMEKDNSQVTVQFRNSPVNRPEQTLLGSMWAGDFNWGTSYDWVVSDSSNWVFSNTGLKNGDHLPGLVGYEYDNVSRSAPIPAGTSLLSSSPVQDVAQGRDDVADATVYTAGNGARVFNDVANATVYTAGSGARVFNASTIQWSWGLDGYGHHDVVNPGAQKITRNVLVNFLTVPILRH